MWHVCATTYSNMATSLPEIKKMMGLNIYRFVKLPEHSSKRVCQNKVHVSNHSAHTGVTQCPHWWQSTLVAIEGSGKARSPSGGGK